MCGLTVIVRRFHLQADDIEMLARCNDSMRYRGPDEAGVWSDNRVAIGHVRLAIIGLSNGRQPILSRDGQLVLVCNGEIYNHRKLREDLIALGAEFATESDSEVILHAYRTYGADFITRLKGMFSFVLYDKATGQVIAARDAAGKKPLYYADLKDGLVISSEVAGVAEFATDRSVDWEVVRQVQSNRYSISDQDTFLQGVKKVRPGHILSYKFERSFEEKRWAVRSVGDRFDGDYEAAVNRTRELIFKAVEKRLEAEVPIALTLSAGIDSSAIACVCSRLGANIQTFSAGYLRSTVTDESEEAEWLARKLGLPFERVSLDERAFEGDLLSILKHLDEPNGDPAMFAQWSLYRKIQKRGFKVVMSGIGGDEVFYGYPSKNHLEYATGNKLGRTKTRRIFTFLRSLVSNHPKATYELLEFLLLRTLRHRSFLPDSVLPEVVSRTNKNPGLQMHDMVDAGLQLEIDRTYSALRHVYLPNNGFFLADRLAMAHSIEVRCPFADADLAHFVDGLPIEYKFPRQEAKGLLKDALRGVVPDRVLDRAKTGFTPPSRYVLEAISNYQARSFTAPLSSLAQVATDFYSAKCATR